MRGLRLTRVRGVPRAGEVLGFGELVWSQLLCDAVAISIHIPEVEPHMGTHIVLRHTATFGEGGPEAVLRASIPLLRASRNQCTASASSCGTPRPVAYANPSSFCAGAWPCSAASRNQRTAAVSIAVSRRVAYVNPSWYCAGP